MDNLRNLWPLSEAASNAGNAVHKKDLQYQKHENEYNDSGGPETAKPEHADMNGKWFRIKSISK